MDPDGARQNPQEAVDALERRIQAGRGADGAADDDGPGDADDEAPLEPAFEMDLDPGDQGSAAAGASNPD